MKYRADIDGLRTLAVMAVIVFHAGFEFLPGGFLGVDIFFVISGYLITSIIAKEVEATTKFNYARFYTRRVRRLFPTLITVVLLSLCFAPFVMPADLLSDFGSSILYVFLSISNIFFWLSSGYFDSASEFKPLLHTWSLSVEEQFYLIWPTLIGLMVVF